MKINCRICVLFMCVFAGAAQATGVRIDISGTITDVEYTVPNQSVLTGDGWSASFFVPDSLAPSTNSPTFSVYNNFNGVLNLGGQSIALGYRPAANGGTVLSMIDATNRDQFNVGGITENNPPDVIDGFQLHDFGIDLYDPSIFTGSADDLVVRDLWGLTASDFQLGSLFIVYAIIDGNPFNSLWEGEVDYFSAQVVPLPPTIWLLGSALGLLGWLRR